jgi:pseudaminic acid biosynthesis-associated methylase
MSTPQVDFWKNKIVESYVRDNSVFDRQLGLVAWERILSKIDKSGILSYLDCGSNIGRNIALLRNVLPSASANIIELAKEPFDKCVKDFQIDKSFLGSIKDSTFDVKFDLVFTSGVLIHTNPDDLLETMSRMYEMSSRYILIGEYFNRTPTMIRYRDEDDKLFKRDFGKLFLENFKCKLIDYGFLWGHEFDAAGFDDVTFWIFEKTNQV